MRVQEIGSEYHYCPVEVPIGESTHRMFPVRDYAYTYSGRTSIETVLRNLTGVKKALLPSYCCDSMIEPFRAAKIEVAFYDVFWDTEMKMKLQIEDDVDLILWCNYFGFRWEMPDLSWFLDRGGILVEDITHSYLSDEPFHTQSQFLIASVRKWFPLLCGGYCASQIGEFQYKPRTEVSAEFIEMKALAMKQKAEYLACNDERLKEQYLENFSKSNHWLAEHYSELKMDPQSSRYLSVVDVQSIKERRKENAAVIYAWLRKQKRFLPLFDEKDMDCPLFVPIICKDKTQRDALRQRLIAEKIYCPIHWPQPKHNCSSNLYDLELSLICDQRYGKGDMNRMMQVVCAEM